MFIIEKLENVEKCKKVMNLYPQSHQLLFLTIIYIFSTYLYIYLI